MCMTENIEPTPASAISKLSDIGEIIERALVSEDELTREVGAIALEATQAMCEALAKVPKWISVKERLPDTTDVYLIHTVHRYNKNDGYRCMDVRLFFKGEFEPWQGLPDIYEVTHWMYMPEPPKECE